MKYLNTLMLILFLTSCFEKQADCDEFNHESRNIYQLLANLDDQIKIRVEAFDQEKPEDLLNNENYQQLLNLKSQKDLSLNQMLELTKLHPQCPFEKTSPLGLEIKQFILDYQ